MMKKMLLPLAVGSLLFISCSKKMHPARTGDRIIYQGNSVENSTENTNSSNTVEVRKVVVNKPKVEFPQAIHVNDRAAKKSVDGRLYYDLKGHRYWKNYKDGKYYIFNKEMYNNPDFKPTDSKKKGS